MPYINLRWKGYPHHHLPKIRVASTPSVSFRERSNAAAQQVLRIPLEPPLEEKRKRQRFFRLRRRRARSSSRASAKVQVRRQVSKRARQKIQIYGWDTPNAELASQGTTEVQFGSGTSTSRSPRILPPHIGVDDESLIVSIDGVATPLVKQTIKPKNSEGYYSSLEQSKREFTFADDHISDIPGRRQPGKYSYTHHRTRAHNPSSDPIVHAGNRGSAIRNKPRVQEAESSKKLPEKKKQRSISTDLRDTINSVALKAKKQGSQSPSIKSFVQYGISDFSRTPSQKRALRRYTREIELYWQAVRTLPRQSLIPSTTATTISARTVTELKPYHYQFQSAGLAVTSKEQRGETTLEKLTTPPPTPRKDKKWEIMATRSKMSKVEEEKSTKDVNREASVKKAPSFASSSTGTTILTFTPPYEKSQAQALDGKQYLSSDHTVLDFGPDEKADPPSPKRSLEQRSTTRRSIPWLRQASKAPEASPEASPTRQASNLPIASRSTFPISPKSSPGEHKRQAERSQSEFPRNRDELRQLVRETETAPRQSSAIRWRETSPISRKVDSHKMEKKSFVPAQSSNDFTDFVSTAVQADVSDVEATGPEIGNGSTQSSELAPIPSGLERTFSGPPKKRSGDSQNLAEVSPPEHLCASMPTWQRIESTTQTDVMDPLVVNKSQEERGHQVAKLPSPSAEPVPTADCCRTIPSPLRNTRSSKFVQHAPQMRIQSKRTRTEKARSVQVSNMEGIPPPPNRQPPPPPCSQCGRPLESDSELNLEPGKGPAHTCISRPSLLCQQCFPSQISPAISPVEVSYLPSSRRSNNPIVPKEPVTYTAASKEHPVLEVTQCLDSEKDKEMHKAIVKEALEEFTKRHPITNPMRRPSLHRLKLKLDLSPQELPKRRNSTSSMDQVPMTAQTPVVITSSCPSDYAAAPSTSVYSTTPNPARVTDKQLFRGLHVATAAACDEDVDKWIEEITGTGVRKFLADLSALEGLGVNTLANVAKRAAKQRRGQVKAWEEIRERKLASHSREMEKNDNKPHKDDDDGVQVGEFVSGDQDVNRNGGDKEAIQEGDTLTGDQRVESKEH